MSKPQDNFLDGIFEELFQSAAEGLIVADSLGNILIANPSANQMFGYTDKDTMLGMSVEDLLPENLHNKHKQHRAEYKKHPRKRSMGTGLDLFAKKKTGEYFPVEISLNHLVKDGNFYVIALISNITERLEMNNMIIKEKETAQLYLDISNTIFIVIDKNERIELINKKGEEILGYRQEEVIGENWFDNFIPDNIKKTVREQFNKVINSESEPDETFENEVLTKGGELRIIGWKNSVIRNPDGEIRAVLSSGEDITKRKAVEDKLKEYTSTLEHMVEERTSELTETVKKLKTSNDQLEAQIQETKEAEILLEESQRLYKIIARNFPKGTISVFDNHLNYIFVEGKELFELGVTSEMLIGTNLIDRLSEEIKESTKEKLFEVFQGEPKKIEIKLRDNYYLLSAVPLEDVNGQVNQIMVVEQNITESRLVEENIRNALKKERELGELKSRFVSMASHEFRTPLSTVLSSTSLIDKYIERNEPEKTEKHISRIKSAVDNLTNILNDFLSLGKLEEGKVEVFPEPTNLGNLVNDIADEMRFQCKKGQSIVIENQVEEDVLLDQKILINILHNLFSNAIKYSQEGKEIYFNSQKTDKKLILTIRDEGLGIPEEEQSYMFDRFFRAKNVSNIQGTGLGLNIVKKYVELMDGTISFESTEGKGTIFELQFNLKDINSSKP